VPAPKNKNPIVGGLSATRARAGSGLPPAPPVGLVKWRRDTIGIRRLLNLIRASAVGLVLDLAHDLWTA
jgi:hypothetical protein